MQPTSPDKPLNPVFWRLMLLVACMLVFSFALHAKVAVYGHGGHPQPSTSSKLWVGDAKSEPPTVVPSSSLIWLAVFLSSLVWWKNVHRYEAVPGTVVREQRRRQYLHRFLRPPPSR